jgi:signal peptidase I
MIYLGDTTNGFYFVVFDAKGKKLYEIKKDIKMKKVNNSDKKRMENDNRNSWGSNWNWWKSQFNLVFPKYYPAYLNFSVYSKKIFVITYPNMLENTQVLLITNEKGDLLKEKKITAIDLNVIRNNQFYIYKEDMYYLKENENTGNFFIHIVNLKN